MAEPPWPIPFAEPSGHYLFRALLSPSAHRVSRSDSLHSKIRPFASRLLWPRLTSLGPSQSVAGPVVRFDRTGPQRSPRVSREAFLRAPPDLPVRVSRWLLGLPVQCR